MPSQARGPRGVSRPLALRPGYTPDASPRRSRAPWSPTAQPHQVSLDQLSTACFWRDIVRRNEDGSRLSVAKACRQAHPPIKPAAYWYHKRRYTERWREAQLAIDDLRTDDKLLDAARGRALDLLEHGTDGAAGALVRSLLSGRDRPTADVTLVVEQFGDDDFGGGRIETADVGGPDPERDP